MQKARFTWKILNLQLTKKTEINPYTIKLALPRKKIKIITYIKINQRKIHLIKSKSKINITFSVIIVCKDFLASFLRHPTQIALPPFFKFLFPLLCLIIHLHLTYFRQFPLPSLRQPSSCPNLKHQFSLCAHFQTFHKIMVAEKNNSLHVHHNFAKSNRKKEECQEINRKSARLQFKKTYPCTIFPSLFIFQIPPSNGGN